QRVRKYYEAQGIDVRQFGNDGTVAEPHVAEAVFEQMLAEQARKITIFRESRLAFVKKDGRRLRALTLDRAPVDGRGAPAPEPLERAYVTISASVFIDASYEGDLLAAAGISHRCDRESHAEFGEKCAGVVLDLDAGNKASIDPFRTPGEPSSGLIPLVSSRALEPDGAQSRYIQAYNFRLCLVQNNNLPIEPGANYNPATYEIVARMIAAQAAAKTPFAAEQMHTAGKERLLKFSRLPHGKTDVNNASFVSMDFVNGGSERYAEGTWAERAQLWHAHEDYQRGIYYFLRTDPRVPEDIRADLTLWGLPRDEFKDTRGWPTQLYIREARRMVGSYVMRQSECEITSASLSNSVGLGTYSLDSHTCQRLVVSGRVVSEGEFLRRIPGAYSIPYRVLVPRAEECENLLVSFCVSTTHVCFASVRMEPPFMVLGESTAVAAHLALEQNVSVQSINGVTLERKLREAGQILSPEDIKVG
ncbi:MAG: FAD-dependent oxidoreductase, partial [Janthinobacterium lividum]